MNITGFFEYIKNLIYPGGEEKTPADLKRALRYLISKSLGRNFDAAAIKAAAEDIYSLHDRVSFEEMSHIADLYCRIASSDETLARRYANSCRRVYLSAGFEFLKKSGVLCAQFSKRSYNSDEAEEVSGAMDDISAIRGADDAAKTKALDFAGALSTRGNHSEAMDALIMTPETVASFLKYGDSAMVCSIFDFFIHTALKRPGAAVPIYEHSALLLEIFGHAKMIEFARICVLESRGEAKKIEEMIKKFTEEFAEIKKYGIGAAAEAFDLYKSVYSSNPKLAGALIDIAVPVCVERGFDAFRKLASACRHLASNETAAFNLIGAFDDIMEHCGVSGFGVISDFCRTLELLEVKAAAWFIERLPAIIKLTSFSDLADFIDFNLRMIDANGKAAVRWFEGSVPFVERFVSGRKLALYMSLYKRCAGLTLVMDEEPKDIVCVCLDLHASLNDQQFSDLMALLSNLSLNRDVMKRLFMNSADSIKSNGFTSFMEVYETVFSYPPPPPVIALAIAGCGGALISAGGPGTPARIAKTLKSLALTKFQFLIRNLSRFVPAIADVGQAEMNKMIGCLNHLIEAGGKRIEADEKYLVEFFARLCEVLRAGGKKGFDAVASRCGYFACLAPATALLWLSKSVEVVNSCGADGVEKFAERSFDISRTNPAAAEAFVKGESEEYSDFIEEMTGGLKLKNIKPVLKNYVHALLGYDAEIEAGENACTDGEKIYLPPRVSDFQTDGENFVKYKVMATHEEAHLEYGSFDFELERAAELAAGLREKYAMEGGTGISCLERFYGFFPEPSMAAYLFNLVEDFRIEARLRASYPVLGTQIVEINRHLTSLRPPASSMANPKKAFIETLTVALFGGRVEGALAAGPAAAMKASLAAVLPLRSEACTVYDSAAAAAVIYSIIDEIFGGDYEPVKPPTNHIDQEKVEKNLGNFSRAARKFDEKTRRHGRSDAAPGSTEELLRKLYKKKKIKPSEIENSLGEINDPAAVEKFLKFLRSQVREEGELDESRGSYLYPEWGNDIMGYRPKWVRVIETAVQSGGGTKFYDSSLKNNAALIRRVGKEFQILKPAGLERLSRQLYGDDVDVNSAVEYFVDRKTRTSPSEKNYSMKVRRRRDISVALLLDMSGSTAGGIMDCEKNAVVVLSEALGRLGDSFAVYGFESEGRENCRFHVVKDFGRSMDPDAKARVGNITAGGGTLTGAAIRHASEKLKKRPERVKLIILLSDGEPNDTTACPIEDTRMALREAARSGIKTFCITVDPKAADYLPKMYRHSSWTVINDVSKLPEKISGIYRRLTS